jgi:hypothetical protein
MPRPPTTKVWKTPGGNVARSSTPAPLLPPGFQPPVNPPNGGADKGPQSLPHPRKPGAKLSAPRPGGARKPPFMKTPPTRPLTPAEIAGVTAETMRKKYGWKGPLEKPPGWPDEIFWLPGYEMPVQIAREIAAAKSAGSN